ncbi:MAG: phosphopentomutase [Clostridia bacterium]|nr:phosphopentomutase [Clostridia bacterium]
MSDIKRIFLIVLDSCGVGYEPDAADFGDVGADTMRTISKSEKFHIPNLINMGIGHLDGIEYLPKAENPTAAIARMREISRGKDTTIGHWEIAGVVSPQPLPTYPNGFPKELLDRFSEAVGRGVLCNKPYSGTDVIRDYGDEHVKTGKLIVYTSADSVFQIAAHEDVVPLEELYDICRKARELLVGEHGVGRVIARPFIGESGSYKRTANRHDFSLMPPKETMLDALKSCDLDVIAVGKITDIFAGRGVTESIFTHSNREGMEVTMDLLKNRDFHGLAFTNLVDFDMIYGHRQDVDGYANALSEFDAWLTDFMPKMGEDDVLMICADHGCDPGDNSTDHTREYIPYIIYGDKIKPQDLGTRMGFFEIAGTVCEMLGVNFGESSLAKKLLKKD